MKALYLLTLIALLPYSVAFAEDASAPVAPAETTSAAPAPKKAKKKKAKKKKKKKTVSQNPDAVPVSPAPQSPGKVSEVPPSLKAADVAEKKEEIAKDAAATGESDETKNARMKAVEGSKSPYSGQFNLTYSGSSLDHPFSNKAPNPSNFADPPLVTLAGTVSARYRIDKKTTTGIGTGVTTQQPFQGPKNTTVADPYADIARSFRWGPIQNRADFQVTLFTQDQLHNQYGQNFGFSAVDEAFYEFDFGFTMGLALEIDGNTFSGDAKYANDAIRAGQVSYDIYPEPYFEYVLSKRVNLRSVLQVGFEHNRTQQSMVFNGPKVGQTFGVGISAADWLFLYPYLRGVPYSGTFGAKTTTLGMNAIINLF